MNNFKMNFINSLKGSSSPAMNLTQNIRLQPNRPRSGPDSEPNESYHTHLRPYTHHVRSVCSCLSGIAVSVIDAACSNKIEKVFFVKQFILGFFLFRFCVFSFFSFWLVFVGVFCAIWMKTSSCPSLPQIYSFQQRFVDNVVSFDLLTLYGPILYS